MADFEKMYYKLFAATQTSIELIQEALCEAEESNKADTQLSNRLLATMHNSIELIQQAQINTEEDYIESDDPDFDSPADNDLPAIAAGSNIVNFCEIEASKRKNRRK